MQAGQRCPDQLEAEKDTKSMSKKAPLERAGNHVDIYSRPAVHNSFCKNNLPTPQEATRGKHMGVEGLDMSIQVLALFLNHPVTLDKSHDSSDSQENRGNSL